VEPRDDERGSAIGNGVVFLMTIDLANAAPTAFGVTISAEDILESLSFFDTWEERYKYIIDLGKEIPVV